MGLTTFEDTTATLVVSSGFTLGVGSGTEKVITGIKGWYSGAPMRGTKTERLNQHGTFEEEGKRDERTVSISGHYLAPDRATAARFTDEINAYLGDGTFGTLEVQDADLGTRRATVRLMTPDVIWTGGRDVTFHLDMSAPDPRKYGEEVNVETQPPVAGGGLFTEPLFGSEGGVNLLDFGTPGSDGIATITNVGTADTPLQFVVEGPVPALGFSITDVDTNDRLQYVGAILASQWLVIDSRTGTVKLNGYADRATNLVVRSWVTLGPGQTRRFLFEANGSAEARLIVRSEPAWW